MDPEDTSDFRIISGAARAHLNPNASTVQALMSLAENYRIRRITFVEGLMSGRVHVNDGEAAVG